MALEFRSQLCKFENSTNCNEISFDPHSFSELLKGLLKICDCFRLNPSLSSNPMNVSHVY